jgi:uncharacterized membrane protein YcgQ (UPF0703/DUF1980 family)
MFFRDIPIGSNFFDPNSGEYFIKTDNTTAEFTSGGSYFEGLKETFSDDDFVELIEGE